MNGYVDIYLLPVPEQNFEAYRQQAHTFGQIVKEHGGSATASFAATIWATR